MASFFDKYLTPISVGFPPVGLSVWFWRKDRSYHI